MADDQVSLTSFPVSAEVTFNVDAADLCAHIKPAQLMQLIGEIDDEVGSYYFSEIMYRMFKDIRDGMLEQRPELSSMDDDELLSKLLTESDNV
jgi:hypothetical protein